MKLLISWWPLKRFLALNEIPDTDATLKTILVSFIVTPVTNDRSAKYTCDMPVVGTIPGKSK